MSYPPDCYVLGLEEIDQTQVAVVGGKGAQLGGRRRDGARNWMLLRDLGNPEIWIERYNTPTWLDYVRHNSRLTQDDAMIPERLRALHRGPASPVVRRMIERQTDSLPATGDAPPHDLASPMH